MTGSTDSFDFPTTPGAADTSRPGNRDAFVTKVNPAGSALEYSTYLGGTGSEEQGDGIAVDGSGRTSVTGDTYSADFPTTPGAFDATYGGDGDLFVTKLDSVGSALTYSTYLGGAARDQGNAIALGTIGSSVVTGFTSSADYPTTAGSLKPSPDPDLRSHGDAFVTKLFPGPEGYARPRAATPLEVSLVPAYAPCTASDRTHGPPLDSGSCSSPAQASDELTLGAPDANGKAVRATGRVQYAASVSDVRIRAELNDVYEQPALTDYSGGLWVRTALRITDKFNNPGDNATVSDIPLGAAAPCTASADPDTGSDCNLLTSANTLVPGAVTAGKRSVWELGQVQVDDGGADGDAYTPGDNTLFMVQGVFVP